jgi:flavodoxin
VLNAILVFDSMHGNTEQVARAIAAALEGGFAVRLRKAEPAALRDAAGMDLILVGGPTRRHRMSRRLRDMFDSAPHKGLRGIRTAAFDTRYRMPAWLSGSAAGEIARKLRKLGGRPLLPPRSFFVARDIPPKGSKRRHKLERMEPGELERAAAWAAEVARAAENI